MASEFRNRLSVLLESRIKAVTMRQQGKTLETIGRELNRAISCIKRIIDRYRPRSGRKTRTKTVLDQADREYLPKRMIEI